jgi:Zn-dependent M32 family carboxypeptidase
VDPDLRTLKERVAEITDLYSSLYLLDWDQKVTMPPGGYPARAEALATLGRIRHERFVDDELGVFSTGSACLVKKRREGTPTQADATRGSGPVGAPLAFA